MVAAGNGKILGTNFSKKMYELLYKVWLKI
jgi:hypothetical protein